MKNYYINADIGEGVPSYDFVIKAKTIKEAGRLAYKEIRNSYPDYGGDIKEANYSIHEVTAEELLNRLTIN